MNKIRIIKRDGKHIIQYIDTTRCRWVDRSSFDTFYDAMVSIQRDKLAGALNYDYYDKVGHRVYTQNKAVFALTYITASNKFVLVSYLVNPFGDCFVFDRYDDAMAVIRSQCIPAEFEGAMND